MSSLVYGGPVNSYRQSNNNNNKTSLQSHDLEQPMDVDDEAPNINGNNLENDSQLWQFLRPVASVYPQAVFKHAGTLYSALKHDIERPEDEHDFMRQKQKKKMAAQHVIVPHIDFSSGQEKRLTYQLAFNTLKYQQLLEDILEDVAFFSAYPEYREEEGAIMTMLYDLQQRKFPRQTRISCTIPGDPHLDEMEEALSSFSVKLNAALARCRIKAHARTIEHLLPERVREKGSQTDRLPVYAWVNQAKASIVSVTEELNNSGYRLLTPECDSQSPPERAYCVDHHCSDLLIFHADERQRLSQHHLVEDGHIVIQDKSGSLGPHSVKALLNEGDDCVHVNVGSGATTAHLASLVQASGSQVFAFGVQSPEHQQSLVDMFAKLDIKNVKLIAEDFNSLEPDDVRFKNTKVILVTADCSKSGVRNPVDFIVNEGEDPKILHHLSAGENSMTRSGDLVNSHSTSLRKAMKFPRVQGVVYTTRSIDKVENENIVSRCVDSLNTSNPQRKSWRVGPPVIQLDSEESKKNVDKYLRFPSTASQCGCFTAVLVKEAEEIPKESAKDVLARAAGLLDSMGEKKKKKTKQEVRKADDIVTHTTTKSAIRKPKVVSPRRTVTSKKVSPTRRRHAESSPVEPSPPGVSTEGPKESKKKSSKAAESHQSAVPVKSTPPQAEDNMPRKKTVLKPKPFSWPGK